MTRRLSIQYCTLAIAVTLSPSEKEEHLHGLTIFLIPVYALRKILPLTNLSPIVSKARVICSTKEHISLLS